MFNVGPTELLVILVLALMVFGPKRLPEMSRQIGRGLREFRRATQDVQSELHGVLTLDEDDDEADAPASSNGSGPPKADTAGVSADAEAGADLQGSAGEPAAGAKVEDPPPPVPPTNGNGSPQGHTVIDPSGD